MRRAKNDQDGNGRLAALSADPVETLNAWLTAAAISKGPLFKPIYRDRMIERSPHSSSVPRILKAAARRAQLLAETVAELSGHSMRIGCAQDLNLGGHDLLTIRRAGGCRSANVVAR